MTPGFRAVVRKEIRQVTRDRRMLPMLTLAPLLQTIVFGFAMNLEIDRIDTVICDLDGTAASRAMARALEADGTFRGAGPARDCARPDRELIDGRASVAVVIPQGLARDLAAERSPEIQVLVDGTNPTVGRFASVAAEGAVEALAMREAAERLSRLRGRLGAEPSVPGYVPQPRLFYNPRMRSAVFMVPAVSAMLLLIVTTILMSMGIARERELGTLEQVLVTPLRPGELILGKLTPFVAVGLLNVILALVAATWVFDVPVRGSLVIVATGTFVYLLNTLGLGLLISTLSRTQQQAFMGGFFTIMPLILLSGFITPVESMPWWLQPIAYANPVRYFVEILRGVLLKDAGFVDVAPQLATLATTGVLLVAFSVFRFRKRLG